MTYNRLFFKLVFIFSFAVLSTLAQARTGINLKNIRYGMHGDTVRVVLEADQKLTYKVSYINQLPYRYILDTQTLNIKVPEKEEKKGQTYFSGYDIIKQIRYAISKSNRSRFVFDLSREALIPHPIQLSPDKQHKYYRLVIDFHSKKKSKKKQSIEVSGKTSDKIKKIANAQSITTIKPLKTKSDNSRKNSQFGKPVIIIDAGHGGNDPGAISHKGSKEKYITLKAALELKKELEKLNRYKVILTRKRDQYLSLDKRVEIARENNAVLFVSLHADSVGSSQLRGASVYTLSNRAEQRVNKVLRKQNWIMDVDLKGHSREVSNILVDLAQRETKTSSAKLAETVISEVKKASLVLRNTHRRAGYYVLLAPDVPAILIEMGFLSNRKDEANLNSRKHRRKLMRSISRGIDRYFKSERAIYISKNK